MGGSISRDSIVQLKKNIIEVQKRVHALQALEGIDLNDICKSVTVIFEKPLEKLSPEVLKNSAFRLGIIVPEERLHLSKNICHDVQLYIETRERILNEGVNLVGFNYLHLADLIQKNMITSLEEAPKKVIEDAEERYRSLMRDIYAIYNNVLQIMLQAEKGNTLDSIKALEKNLSTTIDHYSTVICYDIYLLEPFLWEPVAGVNSQNHKPILYYHNLATDETSYTVPPVISLPNPKSFNPGAKGCNILHQTSTPTQTLQGTEAGPETMSTAAQPEVPAEEE